MCLRKSHRISKNFVNFAGKHLCWSLFLIKLQTFSALQTFSFEICEVFKNTYLVEYLRTTDCFSDLKPGIWVFHDSMFFLVSKQLSPRKMVPPDNCLLDDCPPPDYCFHAITPKIIGPWQYSPGNCLRGKLPFGWFVAYIVAPRTNGPEENCPTGK